MQKYNLGFISDKDIYNHVRATVKQYRRSINMKEFNKNIIDPIKLTFDAKIYNQSLEETIKSECIRQIDKTNNNRIGYFHQYLSKYAGNGQEVPANGVKGGFDVINDELHIYAEMKNKHNTMNSASASKTYMKMQNKLLRDDKATCVLVEVISRKSQDITWKVTVDKEQFNNNRIRKMSIDKFYEMVFHDSKAFFKLCMALPKILDDILEAEPTIVTTYEVYNELDKKDFLKSLYKLAFSTYEGFEIL